MASRSERQLQRWLVIAVGLVILTLVSPLVVEPVADRIRLTLAPDAERDRSSGIVRILRELQFSLADICYARSILYQHRGVVYQIEDEDILAEEIGHERQEGLEAEPGVTSPTAISRTAHKHEGHEEAQEAEHRHDEHEKQPHRRTTIIPHREEDFRGVIGDVEREVKPFDPKHASHVEPEEAIPWLRLATLINPCHENAWVATAFWLSKTEEEQMTAGATSRAIGLLERARRLPMLTRQALLYELGHLYLHKAKNFAKARDVLSEATVEGERRFNSLDESQRHWLELNFINYASACRQLGSYEKAIQVCERGLRLFPDDWPLQLSMKRVQQLLSAQPQKASPK